MPDTFLTKFTSAIAYNTETGEFIVASTISGIPTEQLAMQIVGLVEERIKQLVREIGGVVHEDYDKARTRQ